MKTIKITLLKKSFFLLTLCLFSSMVSKLAAQADPQQVTKETFHGKMALDIRDSKSDWTPYLPKKAPAGAPNILFILYDDTGMAAWSPYGGAINMPTMQKLADNGITYSQWHTTALCSPTRSTLLTGRNHHLNGMAAITETADGYPGASGRIPKQAATIGQILQDNGWSTFWIGKDHNVPEQDIAAGGPRSTWPLQMGFDRFYGFLGGETNQWYPDLTEDNHFVEPPATPEEGYHLSKDLADHALEYLKDQQATNPSKPWYMWYCPGANHAPHQAPEEYIAKYKGKFDEGYDAYRKWVLPRMIAKGVIPAGTNFDKFNPMPPGVANPADNVLDWNKLKPEEKKLFSRLAEVYAGFSEYTDAQVGRIIDYLEKTGQLENTLVIYAADNGASGEGSESGSVNENKFFNGYPDELKENLKYIDKLGSPDTYEHYPTGWAAAFSTPFKMFKRYSQYAGGTCDPLVMSWPKGIKAKGVVRDQFHHSTDIVPTILDVCGLEMPKEYRGVPQYPLSGVSMRYTFDAAPNTKTQKHIQYFAMLGSRALWKDGWKAVALHAPLGGKGHFDKDEWELYNTDVDRSESNNLAKKYPDKLKELIKDWDDEAAKNLVLPLDDRSAIEVLGTERPTSEAPRDLYKYYPGTSAVPEGVAVNVRGRSYKILADVDVKDAKASGVLFAHGSRFGGHTLFIKDGKLNYVYNFLGIAPEQKFTSNVPITTGKHVFGMEFTREKAGPNGESLGQMKLYIDGKEVASGPMRTQSGKFTLAGDGLCVGFDSGDSVSKEYKTPGTYKGGEIIGVGVSVGKIEYSDLQNEAKRALGRD